MYFFYTYQTKDFGSSGIRAGVFRCELHAYMLTINKLRRGEGTLQSFDPEAGHAHQRRNMDDDLRNKEELNFRKCCETNSKNRRK